MNVVGLRRRFVLAIYDWAKKYLPELPPFPEDQRDAPDVAQPVAVEQRQERIVRPVEANQTATWSPNQTGSVIVAEPPLVRAERLKRERDQSGGLK
jgi:hypothetical protein